MIPWCYIGTHTIVKLVNTGTIMGHILGPYIWPSRRCRGLGPLLALPQAVDGRIDGHRTRAETKVSELRKKT